MGAEVIPDFDEFNYYAKKPVLELHEGLGLGNMEHAAQKYGPKFWGIDRGLEIAPIPHSVNSRLLYFKKVLIKAPEIDSETYKWANGSVQNIHDRGEKIHNRKIVLQRSKKGGKINRPHISTTYGEALQDPDIKYEAYGALLDEYDPVAGAVAALENWRLEDESHAPTNLYLNLGFVAFEYSLLAIREKRMKQLVGIAATNRHVQVIG